jgi:Protein of unknown function (DUF3892)
MVYITERHMVGGQKHEHIAEVRWRDPADGGTGASTRETMVDWIKNKGGKAYVSDGTRQVAVGVVDASPPYIRTYADGVWTDNLLALPTY